MNVKWIESYYKFDFIIEESCDFVGVQKLEVPTLNDFTTSMVDLVLALGEP